MDHLEQIGNIFIILATAGTAVAGTVQKLAHAQGLQHQREAQPHGDPRPASHAPLLEGNFV